MIEINLLPEEFKKKPARFKGFDLSAIDFSKFSLRNLRNLPKDAPVVKIGAIFFGSLVAFHLCFMDR